MLWLMLWHVVDDKLCLGYVSLYFTLAIINVVNEVWLKIQREWSEFDSRDWLSKQSPENVLIKRRVRQNKEDVEGRLASKEGAE